VAPPTYRGAASAVGLVEAFEQRVKPALKAAAKVVYLVARAREVDGRLVLTFPNEGHAKRAGELRPEVERAMAEALGRAVRIEVEADTSASADDRAGPTGRPAPAPEDDDVDLSELMDAPPESHVSGADRIAAAFPGAMFVEEPGRGPA